VFIEHPPENSMVFSNFTNAVPDEGTTFTFGSWICIANGSTTTYQTQEAGGICSDIQPRHRQSCR
jgi:hypothetical protein